MCVTLYNIYVLTALTLITDCQEAHEDRKNLTSAIHKCTQGKIFKVPD